MGNPDEVIQKVGANRRDFLKRVLAGAAFAVPIVASFSIDGLWVGTVSAQSFSSSYCGMPDTGYIGPQTFEAHLSDPNLQSRLNGEVEFTIVGPDEDGHGHADRNTGDDDRGHRGGTRTAKIRTRLTLPTGASVTDAYIAVDSQRVVSFPNGNGVITTNMPLGEVCDFDGLLQAMAAGGAQVFAYGSYDNGLSFNVAGAIQPVPGHTIRLDPV